ncbi:hypothetical protein GCM10022254_46650 [Actinomadura meridiana]|uniref:DUF5753 domain-containing protein n=2 Tax=Actinomadura meridiana TaxID=559626 RepID=A0ABP8CAJ3_9ACTN
MWVPYSQLNRGGLEAAQKSVRQVYEELAVARSYQPKVIPGMAQTEAYTRAALTGVLVEQRVETQHPDEEVEAAVAERMDRQRLLSRPDARWFVGGQSKVADRSGRRNPLVASVGPGGPCRSRGS